MENEKIEKKEKKPSNKEILGSLAETVSMLAQKVEMLSQRVEQPAPTGRPATEVAAGWTSPDAQEKEVPVDQEIRRIVDSILSPSFGVRMLAQRGTPMFKLVISVPKRLSNAPQSHWDFYHCDERVKMIPYVEGADGTRDYVKQVFINLGPEIQAMVAADRAQAYA